MVLLPLVALAIIWPMQSAQLGAIDDHWIIHALNGGSLPVVEADRFRPGYWLVYAVEVASHGTNAAGWFVDRLLLATIALGAGYALARVWLTPAFAVLAATLMLVGLQQEAFARLGPQEAFAVPLTLAGFALIGRRRFAGLLLTTTAAFVKEPFILSALLALGWAWWLGARWSLAVPAAAVLVAGIGIASTIGRGAYSPPVFEGRYLYPFIIPVALVAAKLATRRPVLLLLAVWLGVNFAAQTNASIARANATYRFQAALAEIRGHPYIVTTGGSSEYAYAIDVYLEDVPQSGPCVEVVIRAEATGVCPTVVRPLG